MKKLALLFALALPAMPALALDVPQGNKFDYRVKVVNYNANDVVKIVGHFGYQINIVLQDGEQVLPKGVYMGDSQAWQFATLNNHVFIKPKIENGRTNMTIITNRRAYTLDLSSHWSKNNKPTSNDMYYQVQFRYPADEAQHALTLAQKQAADAAAAVDKKRLDDQMNVRSERKNWNYFVQGSQSVTPDEASDDGRFTYFRFKGNRDIPAIFMVNEDGSESLVNRDVDGDTVTIHSMAKQFVLRKGNAVAAIFNESYDPVGSDNSTGTTIPNVERVIKE